MSSNSPMIYNSISTIIALVIIFLITMAIKSNKAIKISQKHLLGIQDLSINDVNLILDEAHSFIKVNQSKNKKNQETFQTRSNEFQYQEVRVVQISPIYFVNQVVVICNSL